MKGQDPSGERRTRYLLGLLPDEERDALEADYFTADDSFERLLAAEDDLFDDYAAGRMPPAEQAAFRRRYLSTREGLGRLTIAQALDRRAREGTAGAAPLSRAVRSSRWERWVSLAAVLVAGTAILWLMRQNLGLQSEVHRLRAERTEAPIPRSAQAGVETGDLDRAATSESTPPPDVTANAGDTLDVRVSRVPPTEPVELAVTPETQSVRLEVAPPKGQTPPRYGVVIRGPDGKEVWRKDGLTAGRPGDPLRVEFPAGAVLDEEHVLSVEAEGESEHPGDSPSPRPSPREVYRLRLVRKTTRPGPP
jgi:hypothetical protein